MNSFLLVEDNEDDVILTLRAFKKSLCPYPVQVVRGGAEAINFCRKNAEDLPKAVLLDLKMPRVGGFEVLRFLRDWPQTHSVPVIILTSSKENSDIALAYALGANSYMRKPVDYNSFVDAVEDLSHYWMEIHGMEVGS